MLMFPNNGPTLFTFDSCKRQSCSKCRINN